MNPKVSVIIPNYNHSAFLGERICSVLNQTYPDFEVIILDDCSSDNSREIIEGYRHNPKISNIVYNESNSGSTFKQWEKGISLAKGEIIWIAESDDIADFNFLEKLVPFFDNCSVGIVFSASMLIDDKARLLPYSYDNIFNSELSEKKKTYEFESKDFSNRFMTFDNNMYNASAILFRKELWFGINKDFTKMRSCGDWLCWLYMLEKCNKVVRYGEILNKFRIHSNKVTTKSSVSGTLYTERLSIVQYVCNNQRLSALKKLAIVGWGYQQVVQSELDENLKKSIVKEWETIYPYTIVYYICFQLYTRLKHIRQSLFKRKFE